MKTISPSGNLTIEDVAEFRNVLIEALTEGTDTLAIDISGVSALDVAGVQLIASALKSARMAGRSMEVNMSAEAFGLLELLGISLE